MPNGADPLNQCSDLGAPSCSTDGSCNGAGACRLYAAGTQCVAATCSGTTFTPARTCNGTGTCQTATSSSCAPYACGTGACKTTCSTTADCASPNTCTGTSCGLRPIGAACSAPAQCNSGFCEQGVCCGGASTGTCKSCALAGTPGTCTNVPSGQDPLNQCTDAGAATCGTDGTCNGSGACRLHAAGTQCVAPACSASTFTPARTCNGTGTCQTVTSSSCSPYACGTSACKTSCATTAGSNAVALSTLTIRYWYTLDAPVDAELSQCDFAQLGCNNIVLTNVALSPTRATADHYFQVAFAAGAGNLGAGSGNTGEIQIWFHKTGWTTYAQGNDPSFDPSKIAYADWNRVTLYQNGTLVWGIEPAP